MVEAWYLRYEVSPRGTTMYQACYFPYYLGKLF